MREVWRRLRAALTPQVLLLLAAGMILLAGIGVSADRGTGRMTALERRIGDTLSDVQGAGRVRVVILTRQVQQGQTGLTGADMQEMPSGAVAVAEGADDPLVNMRLTQALCSLLGLPATAVTVMSGTGGN